MATNNAHVPDDLLQAADAAARSEGKTRDEWLADTVQQRITERGWQDTIVGPSAPFLEGASAARLEAARADYRKQHSARRR